jgi:hypothetical protein
MKIRSVTIEVEVPWEFDADAVLECVHQGFSEIGFTPYNHPNGGGGIPYPHQE